MTFEITQLRCQTSIINIALNLSVFVEVASLGVDWLDKIVLYSCLTFASKLHLVSE